MRTATFAFLAFLFVVVTCGIATAKHVELEGLDGPDLQNDDASDGARRPVIAEPQNPEQCRDQCQAQEPEVAKPIPRAPHGAGSRQLSTVLSSSQRPKNFYLEGAALIVLIFYVIVAVWGARANGLIAEGFARTHCVGESAIFQRQFALCGAGEPNASGRRSLLLKESASTYKFYASGRRHCQGCLATLQLKTRADLMSWPLSLFLPSEDLLEIEIYMNEANTPLTVLAIGTPRQMRSLSDRADVAAYARSLKVPSSGLASDPIPHWPAQKLSVLAEHSSLFYDLFSDPRVHAVFTSPAHADKLRLFRSLLLTSENSGGSHKQLLRFVFALPAADDMAALGPLLGLVPLLIDLVAVAKLTPEAKKKAMEARARQQAATADAEENRRKRIEEAQKRKQEKAQEERERLSRLAPEARRKAEEKLAKQAAKKSMKVKMVRM